MWPCWLHGGYQVGKFKLIGGHIFVRFWVHREKVHQNHRFSQRWQLMENGGCRCFVSGKILAKDENGEISGN